MATDMWLLTNEPSSPAGLLKQCVFINFSIIYQRHANVSNMINRVMSIHIGIFRSC